MKRSYEKLYAMLGILGIILPFLDVWKYGKVPPSISDSYYSPAIVVFTLILGSLGITLFNNEGFKDSKGKNIDKWCNRISGVAAIGVVSFPCNEFTKYFIGVQYPIWHYISACVLFATFSAMCFVFTNVRSKNGRTKRKVIRNVIYTICGLLIIVGMVFAKFVNIFWGEVIALESFGIAYLMQGKVFRFLNEEE